MKCYISLIVLNRQFTFIVVVKYDLKRLTLEQQIQIKREYEKSRRRNFFSGDKTVFVSFHMNLITVQIALRLSNVFIPMMILSVTRI